jgi:2-C-methyl-D-erythritol 4-phosphate cytidylyltransferase
MQIAPKRWQRGVVDSIKRSAQYVEHTILESPHMSSPPRCFALVPCAGLGTRAGAMGPKQYAALGPQAVVAHTLVALQAVPRLVATLVVLSPGDVEFESHAAALVGPRVWVDRCGGATRAATVANGLLSLRARGVVDNDWVLVHDAARCLLQPAWVDRLIDACLTDEVGGLLALPLADTLKAAVGDRVSATLPRADKWAAQTPQMFRLGLLQRALAQAGDAITDESSAIEALGLTPKLVVGDAENLKLTWPADFALAQRLLETR